VADDELLLKVAGNSCHAAVSAIMFAVSPAIWPAFIAFAEQKLPGTTWDEEDRRRMIAMARFLAGVADETDRRLGDA
jgi:hypothetical protein